MRETLASIAIDAGHAILAVYESSDFNVEMKSDDSPLTRADLASHAVIVEALARHFPEIPVLSEEGSLPSFSERQSWPRYFLIDPLDGTKEFIARNGEFTVNIALIDQGVPVVGIVHVPVLGVTYSGSVLEGDHGAWKVSDGQRQSINARALTKPMDHLVVVASRRHGAEALDALLAQLRSHLSSIELTNMGSSLKLCLVASGDADFYPRLAPTSEWDTAAAHAVVLAAGGEVVDTSFAPLRYNTKAEILNPHFFVIGDPSTDWQSLLFGQD